MKKTDFKVPIDYSLKQLQQGGKEFIELFNHGSLSVEIYSPNKVDKQTPHTRDEVYVIVSGSGEFQLADERTDFSPGDVLFVPAGEEHRFENFTNDFVTWVFFYGPEGGENEE